MKWLIGIDEVGRGPLAGPVGVGAVRVSMDFDWSLIPGVGDSKRVSPNSRVAIFRRVKELKKAGLLEYSVTLVSAKEIDKKGIMSAVNIALVTSLYKLCGKDTQRQDVTLKLDGGLKAPAEFKNQETIIRGDSKEFIIGLASIVAKVTRDAHMEFSDKKYPQYQFSQHKGYGTVLHRRLIKKYGLSEIHRASYCQNIKIKL